MKHISYINKKPSLSGAASVPDGAYNGNGDLAVVLGNQQNGLRIYISKTDLWYGISHHDKGGARPLGYIDIDIPADDYSLYAVEQDMDMGEIRCSFGNAKYRFAIKVIKTENVILIDNYGENISPCLRVFGGETDGTKGEKKTEGADVIFRSFEGEENVFATHCFAASGSVADRFAVAVETNHSLGMENAEDVEKYVVAKVLNFTAEGLSKLEKNHNAAWKSFWEKSSFNISDEVLELSWYASQYVIACACGSGKFAPGLYGNFITVEYPNWHSDYHLNYNYQAPFYAVCSSNHPELTDSYHVPLEEFVENGKRDALKFGCSGIILPVGIGPKGVYTEYTPYLPHWFERLFLGQKSNAIHSADIMVFRWRATKDVDYAREHAYPFIKECLAFFEDYMVFENGRYSVKDDAAHEVPMYREEYDPKKFEYRYVHDKNNILTLGLLRMCIPAAIEMAQALGVDEDKCAIWQNILDKLPPFPVTISRYGKIYRYTEKGQRNHGDNDVGLQHIYPAGCIGLCSPEKELKTARRSFRSRESFCWTDGNAISSYYPMAARLGINPQKIVAKLHILIKEYSLPNMLYLGGGGGLEYCSAPASTLNEMVLQSYGDVISIFPCWDKSIDASFSTLRADGAFLVSSSIKNGVIGKTVVFSEKGGCLKILNPYGRCTVTKGAQAQEFSSRIYETLMSAGETIVIEKI